MGMPFQRVEALHVVSSIRFTHHLQISKEILRRRFMPEAGSVRGILSDYTTITPAVRVRYGDADCRCRVVEDDSSRSALQRRQYR